jgi:transcriptional regulator with XRE-family HTH domain
MAFRKLQHCRLKLVAQRFNVTSPLFDQLLRGSVSVSGAILFSPLKDYEVGFHILDVLVTEFLQFFDVDKFLL